MRLVPLSILLAACGASEVTCELVSPDGHDVDVDEGVSLEALVTADAPTALSATWRLGPDDTVAGPIPVPASGEVRGGRATLPAGDQTMELVVWSGDREVCSDAVQTRVGDLPLLTLVEPSDGLVVPADEPVRLTFEVDRAVTLQLTEEDGPLLGEASTDGPEAVSLDLSLPAGAHPLVATAAGEDGLVRRLTLPLVANARPSAPTFTVEPFPATAADDVTVRVVEEGVDPEGAPVTYVYRWTRNEQPQPALTGPVAPADFLRRGQTWTVAVSSSDGTHEGPAASFTFVVENAPPVVPRPVVLPASPTAADVVTCDSAVVDPDEDALTVTTRWFLDGTEVATGATLPVGTVRRGERWSCEVTATDPTGATTTATSAEALAANALPTGRAVVTPVSPAPGESVACAAIDLDDADGDAISVSYRWTSGGMLWDTGATTTAPDTPGGSLLCTADLDDGLDTRDVSAAATVYELATPGNILVVLLDDVAVDKVGVYGVGVDPPPTPTIDGLADAGVRFDRAWSNPTCSPTRSAVMTGRSAWRTGIGVAVSTLDDERGLDLSEVLVPEVLGTGGGPFYASVAIGKWHLGVPADGHQWNPMLQGFASYRGNLGNLRWQAALDGEEQDYFDWEKGDDGVVARTTGYLTTDEVDDAVDAVTSLPEPWFVYLALHAPHTPVHVPPADLHGYAGLNDSSGFKDKYDAMIEAADTELGRLLTDVDLSTTTVIVMGDNGTTGAATRGPYTRNRAKTTAFEGGVRVPLVVAGRAVTTPGTATDALVQATDLFATVVELGGAEIPAWLAPDLDSVSIVPYLVDPTRPSIRSHVLTERFDPNHSEPADRTVDIRAIRDDRWKLMYEAGSGYRFYDIGLDWTEGDDLLEAGPLDPTAQAAYDDLLARLEARNIHP